MSPTTTTLIRCSALWRTLMNSWRGHMTWICESRWIWFPTTPLTSTSGFKLLSPRVQAVRRDLGTCLEMAAVHRETSNLRM